MGTAPFVLVEPSRQRETPVLVEIPHAGLFVPQHIRARMPVPASSFARDADLFVDELFADAPDEGATLLRATHSRYVVDLNRAEDDVDRDSVEGAPATARAPRGVIWRLSGHGVKLLESPLSRAELEQRLSEVHRPYHAEIERIVARKLERFGIVVLLAAHSMPSHARFASGEVGPARADVVPGTRGRTTADARFIDAVEAHATARGWTVSHDDPYRGGYTTAHYGRPRDHVHALQVELARRLYMDEESLTFSPSAQDVRGWCRRLVAKLGDLALR
jgi:N-formylglutamate amidohydrolase